MKPGTLQLIIITMLFSSSVYAQVTTGDLQGIVTDTSGNPVSFTEISISSPSLIGTIGATSNENGYFKIRAIPPGEYRMEIRHLSYQTLIIEKVKVMLGRTTNMGQITLKPGKVDLEEVVVIWTKPALDPSSTTLGSYIDVQALNTIPIERDYKSVLTLLPQANTSFYGDDANIFGASGSDNIYFIDGMNVTDPYRSSGGLTIPFNFIRGVDAKQGGYEAEFGKAMGGIINVITPSGSNEFEAGAFSYFTGDALTSKQKKDSLSPRDIKDFNNYDFGLSFGGPVLKDKFWYYLAYNSIFENQDIQMQDYEPRKDKRTIHAYAAKLNWIALNNTRFMFSIIGNQSIHNQVGYGTGITGIPTAELRNIDPVLRDLTDRGLNLALDVKKNTRSGVLFSGSLVYNNWNYKEEGQTEKGKTEPFYQDYLENYISGGYGQIQDINNHRLSFKFDVEWGWKQHNFLGGIETEIMRLDQFTKGHDLGWVFRNDINFYTSILYKVDDVAKNIIPGIFLQDSWQIFNQLRLNYGLRWDAQFFRGPIEGHSISITDQVQPRIGLIYNTLSSGKYKLTAHYGRYYAQYPLLTVFDKILPYENSAFAFDTDPRNPGAVPIDTLLVATTDPPPQIIDPGKLRGEFSDEFVLGFEMLMERNLKFGIHGVFKNLKNGLANYYKGERMIVGNPGSGMLEDLPEYSRKYAALEFSLRTYETSRFSFFTSYVLSVNKGNYTGFFDQDNGQISTPGNYMGLQVPEQISNSYGYMPNDRRHVFKLNASYRFKFGLTAGTSFSVMSGTPLNEFGTSPFGFNRYIYLVERGTAGRLPTLWDLNLRFTYDFKIASVQAKIFLDAFHVGSPMETVEVDELRYFDYEMTNPNENYGNVIQYQPPMMMRLGINLDI